MKHGVKIVNGTRFLTAELPEGYWQYIRGVLGKCAYDEVAPIIREIGHQLSEPITSPSAAQTDFGKSSLETSPEELANDVAYHRAGSGVAQV